jgi:YspA, cpYpsA-related SLOG family
VTAENVGAYRVLICGSRTFADQYAVWCVLNGYAHDDLGVVVIEGGALGADRFARSWAKLNGQPLETFPADWTHDGKAAGPLRNGRMLQEGKPDVVWAFIDKPLESSRGTADMVRRARAAGVPTYVVAHYLDARLAEGSQAPLRGRQA